MTNSRKQRAKKLAKKLRISHQGATNLMRQQQDQDLRDAPPWYLRTFEVRENGQLLPLPPTSYSEMLEQIRVFMVANSDYQLSLADEPLGLREVLRRSALATSRFNKGLIFEVEGSQLLAEPAGEWSDQKAPHTKLQDKIEAALKDVNVFATPTYTEIRFENADGSLWGSTSEWAPEVTAKTDTLLQRKMWVIRRAWTIYRNQVSRHEAPEDRRYDQPDPEDRKERETLWEARSTWYREGVFERFGHPARIVLQPSTL